MGKLSFKEQVRLEFPACVRARLASCLAESNSILSHSSIRRRLLNLCDCSLSTNPINHRRLR